MQNDKTILIFEPQITGHHLEYVHHLYIGATKYPDRNYVFALPEKYLSVKDKFDWPVAENISFELMNDDRLNSKRIVIKQLFCLYRKYNPTEIFFITIMWLMPFLALFSFAKVKLSGIIYNIYLYNWKTSSILGKAKNVFLYSLFTFCRCFNRIFILNDKSAAIVLNKVWRTNKYIYLPDPFVPIDCKNVRNLRQELDINREITVYLHFGAMSERKGTLDIFNMIENTPTNELDKYCIIFAGKVGGDIKEEFYSRYELLRDKIQIILEDDFVDYERIGSYLVTCDAVLLPYKYVNVSSGVIGYCAQYNKPAIAPNKGLIGKLVRKNQLGIVVNSFNTLKLNFCKPIGINYCFDRSVDKFFNTIF